MSSFPPEGGVEGASANGDPAPLPREILVDEVGHVTDVAASLVADGEAELLPSDLRDHLAICPTCTARLGEAALLSLAAREVVREAQGNPAAVPWRLIGPALAVAFAASLPSAALAAAQGKSVLFTTLFVTLRLVARGVRAVAFALGHAAEPALWGPTAMVAALFLVLCGVALALGVPAPSRVSTSGK